MKNELNPAVVIAIIAVVVLAVIGFFVTNAPREGTLRPNPGDYTREPGRDLAQELRQENR